MKLHVHVITWIIIASIIAVFITRHQNSQDPSSCLYKRNEILSRVYGQYLHGKFRGVGWSTPRCDLFGNYASRQFTSEGVEYCVTRHGAQLSEASANPRELNCPYSTLSDRFQHYASQIGKGILILVFLPIKFFVILLHKLFL